MVTWNQKDRSCHDTAGYYIPTRGRQAILRLVFYPNHADFISY